MSIDAKECVKGFICSTNKINADYWLKLVNQQTSFELWKSILGLLQG